MGETTLALNRFLFVLVLFLNRIMAFFAPQRQLHSARFAYLHELESLLSSEPNNETGLLLGESHLSHVLRVRPTPTRSELGNVLVVAPTRGGKGLLAVSQLLTWPHSVVVNDIKGDLYHQTAGYRATLGKVYVIDPTGIGDRYDPLTGKHKEDELLSAATQLLHMPDEGEGVIFTQRAIGMLTQMFLAARLEEFPPLPYVRELTSLGFPSCARHLNKISPEITTKFLDLQFNELDLTDRFILSTWSTLTTKMYPLLTETLIRSLSATDFTGEELMTSKKPITVYLRWHEQDLLALSPLVRLVWESLINELITTYDKKHGQGCQPVLLLVDEAGRTAIPSLADQATTVVGRGVSLWIAVQSLAQLDAVYGHARSRVLRDNMESQIYYRPYNLETAEYLENCLGRRSDYARSQTLRHGQESTQGLSEQGVPLLTAWDIQRMRDEEIISFCRLLQPFRARRMDWRRFPILRQRQRLPAPEITGISERQGRSATTIWLRTKDYSPDYIDPDETTN